MGEALLMANQPTNAKKALEKSLNMYKQFPLSGNRAYVELWLGGCYALEGKYTQARRLFQRAWRQFYTKGSHPESWLQIYYWQGLSEFLEKRVFPKAWLYLVTYPGSWPGSLSEFSFSRLIETWTKIPGEVVISSGSKFKRSSVIQVSLQSTLTERLLFYLILAKDGGLPSARVYELLWPGQVYAFAQMSKRLEQLSIRLRREGIQVRYSQEQHFCTDRQVAVLWKEKITDGVESFLREHSLFKRSDVEEYFKVKKSKAAQMCQSWIKEERVSRSKRGRNISYQSKSKF
jgi:hypothetical protein